MERILSNKVEAALLYNGFDTYQADHWLKLVNEFAAGFSAVFERTKHERPPGYLNFQGHGMTLEITCAENSIEDDVFRNSLSSEVTRREFPDCFAAVAKHTGYIHFAISKGEAKPADPFMTEEEFVPPDFAPAEFDFATMMLRTLLAMQAAKHEPLSVYWAQCDRLFDVKKYLKLALSPKDNSLFVHPVYFQGERNADESDLLGIQTYGANCLIGREVVFEPSPIPLEEAYELIMHFVSITRDTGLLLPEGDVFGRDDSEAITVRYDKGSTEHKGSIILSFMYSEMHGIDNRPDEVGEVEPEPDLDDPAERALQEKIEQLKRQAEAADVKIGEEEEALEEVKMFEQELSGWSGVRKKVDVSELRSLASSSSADVPEAGEVAADVSSLKDRVSGFFSRK